MSQPTALYRHFSAGGELLYVGISLNSVARLSQHRKRPWFTEIATMTTEWHPTRKSAEDAERAAIGKEGPLYNVRHVARERSLLVMPPRYEKGITADHFEWVRKWIDCHPSWKFYAYDFASRVLGVHEDTVWKMCVVPPGEVPRLSTPELMTMAERLARGRYDAEPPITLAFYKHWHPAGNGVAQVAA